MERLFPFLTRLKGNLANKNPRERCRPLELGLNLAGGQTLVYPAAESRSVPTLRKIAVIQDC